MDCKRQFTLRYLLLELFLIGLALGLTRIVFVDCSRESSSTGACICALVAGLTCWGAALGGLFGRMGIGIVVVYLLFILGALLLPAVH
jgi:hypothetical protein